MICFPQPRMKNCYLFLLLKLFLPRLNSHASSGSRKSDRIQQQRPTYIIKNDFRFSRASRLIDKLWFYDVDGFLWKSARTHDESRKGEAKSWSQSIASKQLIRLAGRRRRNLRSVRICLPCINYLSMECEWNFASLIPTHLTISALIQWICLVNDESLKLTHRHVSQVASHCSRLFFFSLLSKLFRAEKINFFSLQKRQKCCWFTYFEHLTQANAAPDREGEKETNAAAVIRYHWRFGFDFLRDGNSFRSMRPLICMRRVSAETPAERNKPLTSHRQRGTRGCLKLKLCNLPFGVFWRSTLNIFLVAKNYSTRNTDKIQRNEISGVCESAGWDFEKLKSLILNCVSLNLKFLWCS